MEAPIAIVGQGCVLPGALGPGALWDLVREGRSALGPAPAGSWRVQRPGPGDAEGPPWHTCGGFVRGFDAVFDARGLGLAEEEVRAFDPLLHWLLHAGRAALCDAGHDPRRPSARVGAVVGILSLPTPALSRFAESVWLDGLPVGALGTVGPEPCPAPRNRFLSGLPAHLAAAALGVGGGAFALDAACASSLYAVKLACDRLRDGEADLMLAGAVSAADPLFLHIGFRALRALSFTGQSRPFHRDADGLVPAEGAACVALKRLEDARRAGDRILGVIRGVGLSNDGGSQGLLAPAEEGQVRALELAYREAGLRPADVSLIECHATGTPTGDATELRSLGRVFVGVDGLPLGSLKSNLGHLLTASGLAGLLKVLAAIGARVRPASLHAAPPLPALRETPFRLLGAPEPWEAPGLRRAAVSSFGFGGCNAHLIVEEWADGQGHPRPSPSRMRRPEAEVAVVGVGVCAGAAVGARAFASTLLAGGRPDSAPPGVPLGELRFPPRDLERILPQQLLVLVAAREALAGSAPVAAERLGVLVGMQCDAEIARHGARRRMGDWVQQWRLAGLPISDAWLAAALDGVGPPTDAAAVLGLLPNVAANRVNRQWGFGGPSFTVAAEECSGPRALAIAARALRAGELDAALVAAVDLCREPVHARAAEEVLPPALRHPGDAAVALVCKRRADAERDGDRIYAVLGGEAPAELWVLGEPSDPVTPLFGHAHAASGLLLVVAAILACHHRALPAVGERPRPWLTPGRAPAVEVRVPALGDQETRTRVRGVGTGAGIALARPASGRGPDLAPGHGPDPDPRVGADRRGGGLAFVFAGAASAYAGMGAEVLLACPDLVQAAALRLGGAVADAAWAWGQGPPGEPSAFGKLAAASLLTQVHAELALRVLGLRPQAALGFSSGETNALAALGAWSDLGALADDLRRVYAAELGGTFDAVARAWGLPPGTPVRWAGWRLLHPVEAVRAALAGETRTRLTAIHAAADCAIAGDADGCARVIARLGAAAVPLGYDLAVHCPEVLHVRDAWRAIHCRPTTAPAGIRFYSGASCAPYVPDADGAADALLAMACAPVDFPALIRRAWDDGVRVFLELGPRDLCTRWIAEALAGREHVAVALDVAGTPGLAQAARAAEALAAAGVAVDAEALAARRPAADPTPDGAEWTIALHWPRVVVPPLPGALPRALGGEAERSPKAVGVARERPVLVVPGAAERGAGWQGVLAAAHSGFLEQQGQAHRQFLEVQTAGWRALLSAVSAPPTATPRRGGLTEPAAPEQPAPPMPAAPMPAAPMPVAPLPSAPLPSAPLPPGPRPRSGAARTPTPRLEGRASLRAPHLPLGPAPDLPDSALRLSRLDLECLAGGRISEVFGPDFRAQDGYRRQVRLPRPPLLLVDRVVGLWGLAGGMGRGRVLTETDVAPDGWYLDCGRMPAGLMVEAGQSDLLLISWLGADRHNRGERVYRLLGCELEFHGDLPRAGETLRYDIRVDGHARHGDVRLFFFSYDCSVEGRRRLSVRNGQAGFFSDEELRGSAGVVWDAAGALPRGARVDPPAVRCSKEAFSAEEVGAFAAGDLERCFGAAFAAGRAHVRTPGLPAGRMRLFSRVARFDPRGGPWGRGYLRAEADLHGDEWFFPGHFQDDPVMPGTLMCQACLQAMAFYLTALGFTLDRDGWRFAPVPGEPYRMVCRGQVTPSARRLVYEVFVHEVCGGPEPTLRADLLLTVDGLKVFHGEGMGLRLVPDWPLTSRPDLLAGAAVGRRAPGGAGLDEAALLACAWGRPSDAFGEAFGVFDGPRRLPRLPGPPYLFMTRVRHVEGQGAGAVAEVEYDVPPDAWYFRGGGSGAMPFCILLEAALQPCGWLTAYLGVPLASARDLHFRNLDGTAVTLAAVRPDAGTLVTRAEVRSVSRAGATVIEAFRVRCTCGDRTVFEMETVFGHFTAEALAQQVGLPGPDRGHDPEQALDLDLWETVASLGTAGPPLPGGELRLLDRLTGWWPRGGRAGLGRIRARKGIDPGEWFFKAHFFQDPVQPGSLGLEAMAQLLQVHMLRAGLAEGLAEPRFEPLALGEPLTWKYRGQVAPTDGEIEVELEVTAVQRGPTGVLARADGWLSVNGLAIYHARGLAMRVVPGACVEDEAASDPAAAPQRGRRAGRGATAGEPGVARSGDGAPPDPGWPSCGPPELDAIRSHWRAALGIGPWVGEDVHLALIRRFVRGVAVSDPAATAGVRGRPVLFCANHQTGIESLLFCTLARVLHGTPVVGLAKVEHRDSWLGGLIADLARYPGVDLGAPLVFFDRADPGSLLGLLESLRLRMGGGVSVLVHVEGTRALTCRQSVSRMSASLVDLALAAGAPIVPLRFAGGLPVDPAPQRLEFPVGYAAQDYHLGAPIQPEALRPLTIAERTRVVLEAIRRAGPAAEEEVPNAPDPSFAEEVAGHAQRSGIALGDAVVLRALCAMLPEACADTRRVVLGLGAERSASPPGALAAWLEAFAGRLHGGRGVEGEGRR